MKAIVVHSFGPVENLRFDERPDPVAGDGEVLIDVAAAAINYPDILVIGGKYQVKPPLPFVAGKELAGTVAAVGRNVTRFKVGDRVMSLLEYGAFAERVAVPEPLCLPVPDSVALTDAAGIGVAYQTAHFALHHRGRVKAGDSVIVTGSNGSVGLAALQLAKAAGASVIGIVSHPDKAPLARSNGADNVFVFNPGDDPLAFREQIRGVTEGLGADLVIDMVGGDLFEACLRSLAWEGRAVIVGFMGGEIPKLRTNYLLLRNIAAVGVNWSDYRDRKPEHMARVQVEIFKLFESGKLKFHRMGLHAFDRYLDAFDSLTKRTTTGKVILDIGGYRKR